MDAPIRTIGLAWTYVHYVLNIARWSSYMFIRAVTWQVYSEGAQGTLCL